MSKLGEMVHFWAQNQHLNFSLNCSLDFTEIAPETRHYEVSKSDSFGFLRKILLRSKLGEIVHF